MATGLIVGESLMGVVYAFAVVGAAKAGSTDSANVLALVEDYRLGDAARPRRLRRRRSLGLYVWTKGRASARRLPATMRRAGSDLPLAAEHARERGPSGFAPASALRTSSTIARLTGASRAAAARPAAPARR